MKSDMNTTKFQLMHKAGIDLQIEETDLRTLLDKHFPDRKQLYDKIEKIVWKADAQLCIYHPEEGTITTEEN